MDSCCSAPAWFHSWSQKMWGWWKPAGKLNQRRNGNEEADFGISLFVRPGCVWGYWQVVDPTTKNMYYTEDVKRIKGGAAQFIDAKTGKQITLQNSEVMEVSKDQFREGVGPK